ncbi:class I SAM-dependent methyltransferase [Alteromonas sp. ASW11-36]|uniref:Ribosomal RNA small subunit methyltransferase J n=1 Tax=Alteromonas arenosi TaxID=3055817 RepID=A0ABT7SSL8_9ALTE|nr:class I SAM-dependent methyltransferase [Alteromonas sp. ASW11-36]MDM7859195.1 class I SAM-dependent methyltransferase [Alteromonas sp. ASW11-36]
MATPNYPLVTNISVIDERSGVDSREALVAKMSGLLPDQSWQQVDSLDAGVGLVLSDNGLSLRNADTPKNGDVRVDFLSSALAYRRAKGGGKSELLVKAIGIKGSQDYRVIDATAGLGTDSFVLASNGCNVTMLERSPLVAALLADALTRMHSNAPDHELCQRLHLSRGDSVTQLSQWAKIPESEHQRPDAIYLDPMFPHRKKSALVKKEMQALQQLLGVDPDADRLLEPALALATKRVVVKRPASAPFLAERKPNVSMSSKKHRFDIYFT